MTLKKYIKNIIQGANLNNVPKNKTVIGKNLDFICPMCNVKHKGQYLMVTCNGAYKQNKKCIMKWLFK
jgi:hypothetical protein